VLQLEIVHFAETVSGEIGKMDGDQKPCDDFFQMVGRSVRDFDWHNGYFIAVLAKPPAT